MPLITGTGSATAKFISKSLVELEAQLPDSLVTYFYIPPSHHYFELTIAENKVEIEPDIYINNFGWVAMSFIGRNRLNFVGFGQFGFQLEGSFCY